MDNPFVSLRHREDFSTKYSRSRPSGERGGIFDQNMSLNGLDDPKVREAHEAAVAEPGGWYVTEYIRHPFPQSSRPHNRYPLCGERAGGKMNKQEGREQIVENEERKTEHYR